MRKHYQVNEIFTSIQGEGRWTGRPATFIRLQGCPVGCEWCDTKYTWSKGGTRMKLSDIYKQIQANHIVITGGEPALYDLDSLIILIRHLRDYLRYPFIQLETSGLCGLKGNECPSWVTVSPKHRLDYNVAPEMMLIADELKYVVDENFHPMIAQNHMKWCWDHRKERPYETGKYYRNNLPKVWLMPEGCPPREEMIAKTLSILQDFPDWNYSDRIQYRIGVP